MPQHSPPDCRAAQNAWSVTRYAAGSARRWLGGIGRQRHSTMLIEIKRDSVKRVLQAIVTRYAIVLIGSGSVLILIVARHTLARVNPTLRVNQQTRVSVYLHRHHL